MADKHKLHGSCVASRHAEVGFPIRYWLRPDRSTDRILKARLHQISYCLLQRLWMLGGVCRAQAYRLTELPIECQQLEGAYYCYNETCVGLIVHEQRVDCVQLIFSLAN